MAAKGGPKIETIRKVQRIVRMIESGSTAADACREHVMEPAGFHMHRARLRALGIEGLGKPVK